MDMSTWKHTPGIAHAGNGTCTEDNRPEVFMRKRLCLVSWVDIQKKGEKLVCTSNTMYSV